MTARSLKVTGNVCGWSPPADHRKFNRLRLCERVARQLPEANVNNGLVTKRTALMLGRPRSGRVAAPRWVEEMDEVLMCTATHHARRHTATIMRGNSNILSITTGHQVHRAEPRLTGPRAKGLEADEGC